MKKNILTVLVTLCLSLQLNAQGHCGVEEDPGAAAAATGSLCGQLVNYIPVTPVNIPVNFIFFQPLSGPGRFDTITQASCDNIILFMNSKFSNLSPPSLPLPAPLTAPTGYTDAKIRFSFKSIQFEKNSQYGTNGLDASKFPVYAVSDPNALNIVFNVNPLGGPPAGFSEVGSNLIRIIEDDTGGFGLFDLGTRHLFFLHETGHALGLYHTHPIDPSTISNPTGTLLAPPPVDDFWYEDAGVVSNVTPPLSANNIMGQTWPARDYLSPKQIGFIHYSLKQNPIVQAMATPTVCHLGADWPMSSGTYSGSVYADANLIIPQGEHVIITGCVYMKPGTRIIVEPGGKLSVPGGRISRACQGAWKGIEVWSSPGAAQSIDPSTQMPNSSVGMLVLNQAWIEDAEIAVNVGRYNSHGAYYLAPGLSFPGSYLPGTAAGIVQSYKTNYRNNLIAANFNPYYLLAPNGSNLSTFREDVFIVDNNYQHLTDPFAGIQANTVYGLRILNCRFTDLFKRSSTGVRCLNGSVIVEKEAAVSTLSTFTGFKYGVYLANSLSTVPVAPSKIRGVRITQSTGSSGSRGGIYLLNTFGTEIADCRIEVSQPVSPSTPLIYGIYLDGCDGYVIQNNTLTGTANAYWSGGIFVNNSGPGANEIYNNTIRYHQQGIWAQNINYDPSGNTGLVMNCNDFFNVRYNIGVQSEFLGLNCGGCPPISQPAGIAETQGVIHLQDEKTRVRNTYHTPNACSDENKFYIQTDNGFVLNSHGSFQGNEFHPLPQPACSDPNELVVLPGLPPAIPAKSSYCPDNYYSSYSLLSLAEQLSEARAHIHQLTTAFTASLDGGQTVALLDFLHGMAPLTEKYDSLMHTPFLSDTVLLVFLQLPGLSPEEAREVFARNAPVPPRVWATLLAQAGWSAALRARMDSLQFLQNRLSPRQQLQSELDLAHNRRGLLNNEKIRRFMQDSTGVVYDSIAPLYRGQEMPNSLFRLLDLSIASGHYTEAAGLIDNLGLDTANTALCTIFGHLLQLRQDSSYRETLQQDSSTYFYLRTCRDSRRPLLDTYSKALLADVYNEWVPEVTLQPAGVDPGWEHEDHASARQAVPEPLLHPLRSGEVRNIRLYPNPAASELHIVHEHPGPLRVQVHELAGRLVLEQDCEQRCTLGTGALKNGIYLVHLYEGTLFLGAHKLVILNE